MIDTTTREEIRMGGRTNRIKICEKENKIKPKIEHYIPYMQHLSRSASDPVLAYMTLYLEPDPCEAFLSPPRLLYICLQTGISNRIS